MRENDLVVIAIRRERGAGRRKAKKFKMARLHIQTWIAKHFFT
jgi:hypothetical protein